MSGPIVSVQEPITLVGGGHVDRRILNISRTHAPRLFAADGGGDRALAHGETPELVIGDMDSLSETGRSLLADRLHKVEEQDTTDFEKALTRIDAPLIAAIGFLDGRLDHTLAVLNVLCRHRARPVVLLNGVDLAFLAPRWLDLKLGKGARVGLMPLETCEVSTAGLRWDLDRAALSPSGRVSSSNEARGAITVRSRGNLLVTLEVERLPAAIDALLAG